MTRPITEVAADLGLGVHEYTPYGDDKAKLTWEATAHLQGRAAGRLVLVTALTPTPAGEGKTTVSIGLVDGLRLLGVRAAGCLREPSLGPVLGLKGGGTGGGRARMVPSDDINLHFTGDLHAVTSATNYLAAAVDNSVFHGNPLGIDPRRVAWRRCLDMDDRSLRHVVTGLGGPADGVPRETGFTITAASEVMALLTLTRDLPDLDRRLGAIVAARTYEGAPVRAADLEAPGAMAVLLRDALRPNLVQTLEGSPVLVHMGPFGNISVGTSSLLATRAGLATADVAVTEAGFASDLGAEKYFNIVSRDGVVSPAVAVVVATVRALKWHGRAPAASLEQPDTDAVRRGFPNLQHHIDHVRSYGVPVVVGVNRFASDTPEELDLVVRLSREQGATAAVADPFNAGGEGCTDLASAVLGALEHAPAAVQPLYPLDAPIREKIEAIARHAYGAAGVEYTAEAQRDIRGLEAEGFGGLPVCMAKTHLSLSADPRRIGRPQGFGVRVRGVEVHAGAGYVIAYLGSITTMPGLPKEPAARRMRLTADGGIEGVR